MTATTRRVLIGGHALDVADDQPTFWDRVERGTWEPQTLDFLRAELSPGRVLVDIGAWVGPTALFAAACGARVVAVEADPAALDQLRRNLAANPDLAARIVVIPRAIAAATGPVRLGARRKPGDSMSSVLFADRDSAWTADAVTPADLVARLPPGEAVVKLDIEGGEFALLPPLAAALPASVTALHISFHPRLIREARRLDDEAYGQLCRETIAPLAGWRLDADEPDAVAILAAARDSASIDLIFRR